MGWIKFLENNQQNGPNQFAIKHNDSMTLYFESSIATSADSVSQALQAGWLFEWLQLLCVKYGICVITAIVTRNRHILGSIVVSSFCLTCNWDGWLLWSWRWGLSVWQLYDGVQWKHTFAISKVCWSFRVPKNLMAGAISWKSRSIHVYTCAASISFYICTCVQEKKYQTFAHICVLPFVCVYCM